MAGEVVGIRIKEAAVMLTGVMLLYVGVTLGVNGLWLVGQARAARLAAAGVPQEKIDKHPLQLHPKEVAIINFFDAGVGIVVATLYAVFGLLKSPLGNIPNAAFIMLFAFTYLFLGINQFLNAGNRVFGWYCFFVALTAVPTGIYVLTNTLKTTPGNVANLWLATNWLVWGLLWFAFFLLLTLELPITRVVGWATTFVAVATCWAFGFVLLQGVVTFPA